MSPSSNKDTDEEIERLEPLSSEAQSLLAELATDKKSRKYVKFITFEHSKVEPLEGAIHNEIHEAKSEESELNDLVFEAFASNQVNDEKHKTDTKLSTQLSDIDKGGDKLINLISEIETDTSKAEKEEAKFSTTNFVSHDLSRSSEKLTNYKGFKGNKINELDRPAAIKRDYEVEISSSPIPKSSFLFALLIFVILFPPIVSFTLINPIIKKNINKDEEILNLQDLITRNKTNSDKIISEIKLIEDYSENIASTLIDRDRLNSALEGFISKLESSGVEIKSMTNEIDSSINFTLGNNIPVKVNKIKINLIGKFETYQSIRSTFLKKIQNFSIIQESLSALPGTNFLNINLEISVIYNGKN